MPPRKTITASFPPGLYDRVEQARGLISRSAWLQRAAEEYLVGRGALEQATGETVSAGTTAAAGTSSPARASEMALGEAASEPCGENPRLGTGVPSRASEPPLRASPETQTDIYEMLAACQECAGKLTQARGVTTCEDCGFTREEG
jgi:hypothetical protein